MNARSLIRLLKLKVLPKEGGFFTETYRSFESIPEKALPKRYAGKKSFSTAIYYLLTPECFSALHRLKSDEVYHFYLGDPMTLLLLYPDGKTKTVVLGHDLSKGQKVQFIVPKFVWQGSFLNKGGKFALIGTTVAPGFDYSDFELGKRKILSRKYPEKKKLIERLTPEN